jgi:drug/metabolite transporter (DMT)-like permease
MASSSSLKTAATVADPADPVGAAASSPGQVPQALMRSGLLLAVLGAVAFSGKAIIVKLAYRHGVDAVTVIMLRMAMALPLFAGMGWWASRGRPALTAGDWGGVLALGFCGYYLASFLDFLGLQYISAGLERLILYINPTLVLLLGWLLQRKPVQGRQWLAMALSYTGVCLVFGQEAHLTGPQVAWGSGLVLLSAVSYALYLFYSGEMVQRLGSLRLVGLATTVACLLCVTQYLVLRPWGDVWLVPEPVLWLSLLNALACTVAPVLLVMMAIERVGAGLVSQTGMVGPMSTLALGALFLDEPFNGHVLLGTMLVLGGVFWMTRRPR